MTKKRSGVDGWEGCGSTEKNELYKPVKGVVHNWRPGRKGGGGQGFCVNSTKVSVIKSVTMGGGGSKNFQNCMTSFMDTPWCHLKKPSMQ
jgi:hypothetical protein